MWPNPPEFADLVTFTEEILNEVLLIITETSSWPKYAAKIFKKHKNKLEFNIVAFQQPAILQIMQSYKFLISCAQKRKTSSLKI